MKEFHIQQHSKRCESGSDISSFFCASNPQYFLFYLNSDFYLISFHGCMSQQYENHLDFKEKIVNEVLTNTKTMETWKVGRANADKDLLDFRRRDAPLKSYVRQINYIYHNAAHRKFAITTLSKYIDAICDNEQMRINYREAKRILEDRGLEILIPDLDELMSYNWILSPDSAELVKTVDHLVKSIRKSINS